MREGERIRQQALEEVEQLKQTVTLPLAVYLPITSWLQTCDHTRLTTHACSYPAIFLSSATQCTLDLCSGFDCFQTCSQPALDDSGLGPG